MLSSHVLVWESLAVLVLDNREITIQFLKVAGSIGAADVLQGSKHAQNPTNFPKAEQEIFSSRKDARRSQLKIRNPKLEIRNKPKDLKTEL